MRETRPTWAGPRGSSGFSMLELLITAFILAVGILGLSMLQLMSMKSARGSRSLSTAVQVAETILDQIEMEGRLTWLNLTDSQYAGAGITQIPTLQYVHQAGPLTREFTLKGRVPISGATDPVDANAYFTATITRTDPPSGPIGSATNQQVHDFTVSVVFSEATEAQSAAVVQRNVTLTRRILHG